MKRVVFKEGYLVLIHLGKDMFPMDRAGTLQPRPDGPFLILEHINNKAYNFELSSHYNVSTTFNVVDLMPFVPDEENLFDSRMSSFEEGGDDADDPS